jgi:hypothetical protein
VPPVTSALLVTGLPNLPPALISVYTTVSILTHVGDPVTLAPDPINGAPGSPTTGVAEPAAPNHAPPPGTTTVTALPEVTAPPDSPVPTPGYGNQPAGTTLTTAAVVAAGGGAKTVVGAFTISRDAAGGVVVDGVTLPAGGAATVSGIAVSVGAGGGVFVAGSPVNLATASAAAATTTAQTSTTGPRPATSSHTSGAMRANGGSVDWRAVGWIVLMVWMLLFGRL